MHTCFSKGDQHQQTLTKKKKNAFVRPRHILRRPRMYRYKCILTCTRASIGCSANTLPMNAKRLITTRRRPPMSIFRRSRHHHHGRIAHTHRYRIDPHHIVDRLHTWEKQKTKKNGRKDEQQQTKRRRRWQDARNVPPPPPPAMCTKKTKKTAVGLL